MVHEEIAAVVGGIEKVEKQNVECQMNVQYCIDGKLRKSPDIGWWAQNECWYPRIVLPTCGVLVFKWTEIEYCVNMWM